MRGLLRIRTMMPLVLPKCFLGKGKWIVVLIVALSSAQTGLLYVWPAFALRHVLDGSVGFTITEQEHANILNVFTASKIVGVFAVSFSMNRFGRKWTLTGFTLLTLLGSLSLVVSSSFLGIVTGRILNGLFVSTQMSLLPVVVGETMEPDMRGTLSSLSVFFSAVTNFVSSFLVGIDYTWYNVYTGLPGVLLFVASLFLTETPYYLLMKGEKEEARKSIMWLRGRSSDNDFDSMVNHADSLAQSGKLSSLLEKGARRAFIIVVPLMISVTVGSTEVLYNFFFVIMPTHPIPATTAYTVSIVMNLASSVASTFFFHRLGRRLITITAFIGCSLSDVLSSVWFLYYSESVSTSPLGWIPHVLFWFKSLFYYSALETLPRLMLSEMFPLPVKGAASIIMTITKAILTIILNQTFYPIRNSVGEWFYFLFCGVFAVLGVVLVYFLLPDTKGQTLEEIQDDLTRGRTRGNTSGSFTDGSTTTVSSTRM